MKISILLAVILLAASFSTFAQKRRSFNTVKKPAATRAPEIGTTAIVMDETLSVLRQRPSLFAETIQRMQRGRVVKILGVAEADDVKFYKVAAPPANFGWVQADAVFGKSRAGDEERLAKMVEAADGFDQVELSVNFLELFPNSKLKPSVLLLFGDRLEEVAAKLSKDANSRLSRREMAASAAPLHSYFLNFVSLDRYRKLGIIFLFNPATRTFHYEGGSWKEIVARYPSAGEAAEAQRRLDALKSKMERTAASGSGAK